MLGVTILGPTSMLGDNMSVVLNTTIPSSQLKKKHNAIAYHRVREAIAGKVIKFAHIPSTENIADIMTKPLSNDLFQDLMRRHLFRKPSNWSQVDMAHTSGIPEITANPREEEKILKNDRLAPKGE